MSEFWLTIIQLILMPTFIVGVLAFVMRELFKKYLSMDVESHKARLKAEHDANQFEFQTKFYLIHQKSAEVISQFFSLVSETEILLRNASVPTESLFVMKQPKQLIKKYNETVFFFHTNKIFFNESLCNQTEQVIGEIGDCIDLLIKSEQAKNNKEENSYEESQELIRKSFYLTQKKISPVTHKLRDEFRLILLAEKPIFSKLDKND